MSKHLSRRELIHAGCTIAGATLVPSFMDQAEAGLRLHGSSPAAAPTGLSQRNVLNVGLLPSITNDYPFINFLANGTNMVSPFGAGFTTTTLPYTALIDANGWVNDAAGNGQAFGGGFQMPDPVNYGGTGLSNGTYKMKGVGNAQISLNFLQNTATWTQVGTPTNCSVTFNSGGDIIVTSTGGASQFVFEFTLTSSASGPQGVQFRVLATGASGFFVKNIVLYQSQDETDLNAGLIWRRAWKTPIKNLCPSALRFMNALGGNSDRNCRFENRTLPSNAGYGSYTQWTTSPVYSLAGGTNQYSCTSSPTTANPKVPATNMVHGEVCTTRFTNGFARTGSGQCPITNITNANPGVVTTGAAHGYNTGDLIGHYMPRNAINVTGTSNSTSTISSISTSGIIIGLYVYGTGIPANTTVTGVNSGLSQITLSNASTFTGSVELQFRTMQNLHQLPCTITVIDTTHYSIGIDTTSFGAFSSVATPYSYQFITLQVGTGGSGQFSRKAYPCTVPDGNLPASSFGPFLNALDTKTWYFDKTQSAQTDGSGNPVMGVWMFDFLGGGVNTGFSGDFPIEVCVALINELNAMSPAHLIGMWMNIPAWALSSMDPDYSAGSDWAVNAVDVVMNPSSTNRASGFSALGYSGASQINQPPLILEYSNEIWPSGTNSDAIAWLINRSLLRWPTIGAWNNNQDYQDMKALRSTCWTRDVKASNPPGLSRIKFIIGLQGTFGLTPGSGARSYETVFGGNVTANPIFTGDWYTNDTLVTSGSWGRPIDNCDGVCLATYFDPPVNYHNTTSGTGTFTDDSAMYNGVDNSGTLSFTGGTGGVSSVTLTTTAFASQHPVLNQPIVGTGISNPTTIIGISGSTPNFTLTLSQAATVSNGTTIKSPSNSGGNYIGAANQSQALTNYVAAVVDVGSTSNESPTRYATFIMPQVSAALPTGKVALGYEGGTDWRTTAGQATDSHIITTGDSLFTIAANNSSQWATAQVNFFTAYAGISKCFMPAIYQWIQSVVGDQQWSYCTPDSFALSGSVPTEGQALLNNAPWVAMSAYNVAQVN